MRIRNLGLHALSRRLTPENGEAQAPPMNTPENQFPLICTAPKKQIPFGSILCASTCLSILSAMRLLALEEGDLKDDNGQLIVHYAVETPKQWLVRELKRSTGTGQDTGLKAAGSEAGRAVSYGKRRKAQRERA
jgi:hypothetical protein